MDKDRAIQQFWEGFGLPAYDENTIPTGNNAPEPPYITYNVVTDNFEHPVTLNGSIWYRSSSWAEITAKKEEIASYLQAGGKIVKLDSGYFWMMQGRPFAQRMSDEDDSIRRIFITVQAEFMTNE